MAPTRIAVDVHRRAPLAERIRRLQDRIRRGEWQTPEEWHEENRQRLEANRKARVAAECFALRRDSGVEALFAQADLRQMDPRLPEGYRQLARRLLELVQNPATLAIGGDRGRGKTWLACAAVLAFCDAHKSALYRRTRQFFDDVLAADFSDKERVRRRYATVQLLVLDEVQVREQAAAKEFDRTWFDNELTTLIDRRYAACRSTVLLSNLQPEDLAANLGASIRRRISESGGFHDCRWPRIAEVLGGEARRHAGT